MIDFDSKTDSWWQELNEADGGHHGYRAGHVDGVHCAASVDCHWRGESVEAWEAHRAEVIGL